MLPDVVEKNPLAQNREGEMQESVEVDSSNFNTVIVGLEGAEGAGGISLKSIPNYGVVMGLEFSVTTDEATYFKADFAPKLNCWESHNLNFGMGFFKEFPYTGTFDLVWTPRYEYALGRIGIINQDFNEPDAVGILYYGIMIGAANSSILFEKFEEDGSFAGEYGIDKNSGFAGGIYVGGEGHFTNFRGGRLGAGIDINFAFGLNTLRTFTKIKVYYGPHWSPFDVGGSFGYWGNFPIIMLSVSKKFGVSY